MSGLDIKRFENHILSKLAIQNLIPCFCIFNLVVKTMKMTLQKNNFTTTVISSWSKIVLCFHFGGQKNIKNKFHKRTTLGTETVRRQISGPEDRRIEYRTIKLTVKNLTTNFIFLLCWVKRTIFRI